MLAASRSLSIWDVEATIITREGKRKYTHALARPHRLPDGSVVWDGVILDATRQAPQAPLIWAVILGASLLMMIGFARAGSMIFWNSRDPSADPGGAKAVGGLSGLALIPVLVIGLLLAATTVLSLGAGPLTRAYEATSAQLLDKAGYVRAVLPPAAGTGTGGN